MPRLIITENANENITSHVMNLWEVNPQAAKHLAGKIDETLALLETFPELGPMKQDLPNNRRQLVIDYGKYGYVALYQIEGDDVIVLAVKAGPEAGYSQD